MSHPIGLVDLRLYLNIVDRGSITAGAQASHLALASASARVLALEQALGLPLLVRSRRGVQPTPAGQTLAVQARAVLQQAERLRAAMDDHARGRGATVRLLGTSAALREHLPERLGAFLAARPDVNILAAEAQGEETVAALSRGEADLGIITDSTPCKALQTLPLCQDDLCVLAPLDHPLVRRAQGRPLPMRLVNLHPVVGLSAGSALQDTWEAHALVRGTRLNYRIRVASFEAQAQLVARGLGVALMPEATAHRLARQAPLAVLTVSDAFLHRRLLLCARQFDQLPEPARHLLQMLQPTPG